MYLGEDGLIPLEVKFKHDPNSTHGFCGAALSSNVIHFWKAENGNWEWEKVIDIDKTYLIPSTTTFFFKSVS